MLFRFLILIHVCAAFPLKCPKPAQWSLRARSHCPDASKYFCLRNDLINGYSENCTLYDFLQPGRKHVLRGGLDADVCSSERYQPWPIIFYTNVSTNCIYLKSTCNEEGQLIYDNGNRNTDATCRCDYRKKFDFLFKPRNSCFCVPSKEDCSCYIKTCPKSTDRLSPDYQCLRDEDNTTVFECKSVICKRVVNTSSTGNISTTRILSYKVQLKIAICSICIGLTIVYCIGVLTFECCWKVFFIYEPPSDIHLIEGESVELLYRLLINRRPSSFLKNHHFLPEMKNIERGVHGLWKNLKITNVTPDNMGDYCLEVAGYRSRLTKLRIQPMFTSKKHTYQCTEGDEIKMTCSVYTDKIEVTWYKDDQELPKCTNILITSKGNHRTLTILKATVPETGTYFVKAQNAEMKISLTVKAVFKQRLVDITIMEGLDTNLECETMEKSCTVQWFKNNGEKIDQPDRKTIKTTQGRIHTLSISETRREDSGTYSIKIKDVTSIAKLDVKEMPGTIKLMSMHDREQFLRAAKSGITKRYNVRVMIVGEKSVGKTCLLRRLMDENIENVTSTDGIDIDRRKCKIDLETEEWHFLSGGEPKGSSDDNKQYADCGFWDFAGQKEFYATHQTFLSANAVYLLVVDISKDFAAKTYNKMIEREFDSIGDPDFDNRCLFSDVRDRNGIWKAIKKYPHLDRLLDLYSQYRMNGSYIPEGKYDTSPTQKRNESELKTTFKPVIALDKNCNFIRVHVKQGSKFEYIDFWLDNIHCYSRDDSNTSKHHNENNLLNPPVIIVGTGIDKLSEVEGKKKDFKHYLSRILSNHAKRRHLRKPHFVSNSHPSDDKHEFKSLREDIFRQAKALTTWGDNLPTRWIVLEKEINTKSHEHYISYTDAERLAKSCSFHDDCQLTVDLDSFLRFEHDIGNIIFFKDLKSFIILDPKWLVDIFRCFVSHQYADDTLGFTEWTALEKTGELADKLIEKFLEKVPDLNTPELKKFALQIMEKFDIIVRSINYEDRNNFYMPCMIKAEPIHNIIGISESQNDRRTSWFCLKFNFLPPSYFNHILVSFRENKELFHEEKKLLRIYRNFGEFRFDKDGKKTLLICLSKNAIAMQVRQSNCTEGVCFSDVKKTLIEIVNSVKQRYGINITYTIKFKCSDGIYFCKRIDLETLMETDEYQCREHKIMHSSKEIYSSWLSEEEVDTQSKNNIHRRCNNCKIKSVYKCFDCKIFLCKDCSRKHNDDDKYLSHSMHLTSDRFSLTSKFKMEEKCIRDIICLLNGDIVVAYSSQLMKYSVSGKQRVVIQLQSSPYKLVVVDKNNVAVLLEYYTMAIVDIQQKHITYISNIAIQNGLDSLTYIENQFYVEVESGIAVLDMSGSVKRRITLSFTPYIICYYVDSKRIYCLDRDNSKLICIDRDGTIVFTCAVSDSTNLQDLTIDKKGNVLALYRKGDDNSAYAIKVDFTDKSSEIEITDIKMSTYRSCMCFNHLTNSIVIASDNEVYIYKKK